MRGLLVALFLFSLPFGVAAQPPWILNALIALGDDATYAEILINGSAHPCVAHNSSCIVEYAGRRWVVSDITDLVPSDLIFVAQVRVCTDRNCSEWAEQVFDCNVDKPCGKMGTLQYIPLTPTRLLIGSIL